MNLENTIRKVSLSLAGLALAANISCTSTQPTSNNNKQPVVESQASVEQVGISSTSQPVDLYKSRVLRLHYHKLFNMQDLYRFYREERPATKYVSFNAYYKRVDKLNNVMEGTRADYLKLPDLNGDGKAGDYN